MKRIVSILLVLFIATGCAKNTTYTMSTEKTTIISENGKEVLSNQDLLNRLLNQSTLSFLMKKIDAKLFELEKLTYDQTIVDSQVEQYKTILGENFETQLANFGYENVDAFKEELAISLKQEAIKIAYIKTDLENILNQYKPTKVQYLAYGSKEEADAALVEIKAGKSFEDVALEKTPLNNAQVILVNDKTNLDTALKEYINNNRTIGTSEVLQLLTASGSTNYYIVNIIETDANAFLDEALKDIAQTIDLANVYKYYFEKYDFKVYEQNLYEQINTAYPGALK